MQTPLMAYTDPNSPVGPKHKLSTYPLVFGLSSRIDHLFEDGKPCSSLIGFQKLSEIHLVDEIVIHILLYVYEIIIVAPVEFTTPFN